MAGLGSQGSKVSEINVQICGKCDSLLVITIKSQRSRVAIEIAECSCYMTITPRMGLVGYDFS
jgi:hypothetical protein